MRKHLTIGLLASSLAFTSPTPVRAGDTDALGVFLGTAATLFILGKAIESDKPKRPSTYVVPTAPPPRVAHEPRIPRVIDGPGARGVIRPRTPAPIPATCLRRVDGGGTHYVVGQPCMNRNYTSAHALPQACAMQVRAGHRIVPAYSVRCLRHKGYTVARH